jgi:lipopolysaccharide export system permease protein
MTVAGYLTRMLTVRLLFALLGLAALVQLLDVFDNVKDLTARGEGVVGMLTYIGLRMPSIVVQVLPVGALVGTLLTMFALVRSNEMLALRSLGYTTYSIVLAGMPLMFATGIVHFALADRVAPWTEARFQEWWSSGNVPDKDDDEPDALWLRQGDTVIRIDKVAPDGDTMDGVTFYTLGPGGLIEKRMEAAHAISGAEGWRLEDVQTSIATDTGAATSSAPTAPWPAGIDPAGVAAAAKPTINTSTSTLVRVLDGELPARRSLSHYSTMLQQSLARPLTVPLMLLLAMPAAYGNPRSGGSTKGIIIGFIAGMAFLIVNGVLSALGEVGTLPPVLAAWGAPILFLSLGGTILMRYEER